MSYSLVQKGSVLFFTVFLLLGLFGTVFAQAPVGTPGSESPYSFPGASSDDGPPASASDDDGPPASSGGGEIIDSAWLRNPLQFNSIGEFFQAVIDVITIIAVPIIVFFIIWAGFLYVTAGGDPGKIQKATTTFTWVVVGGLLILGANVLVSVIGGTVDSFLR